jgi:hypothetical protein
MKTLLTSGCSFTEDRPGGFSWPNLISKQMNTKLVNVGSGMSGNSFISKQLINTIYHHYMNEKDLVVGVMWTDISRKDILISRKESKWREIKKPSSKFWSDHVIDDTLIYPTVTMGGTPTSKFIKSFWMKSGSINWEENVLKFWKTWYRDYYTFEGMFWETLENILRTQWFLEKYNIPYFMTSVTDLFTEGLSKYEEPKHLYDLIDMDKFCLYDGTKGIYEHNIENNIPFDETKHSTREGHEAFCEDVIIPKVEKYFK